DGYYDVRITAELWETYYIDYYAMLAVDHPPGTEVFVDERFAVPPPALKMYATETPRMFARAVDDHGDDVSATIASLDALYLDTFGRGQFQGVTRDHFVELELPADAPLSPSLGTSGEGGGEGLPGTARTAPSPKHPLPNP